MIGARRPRERTGSGARLLLRRSLGHRCRCLLREQDDSCGVSVAKFCAQKTGRLALGAGAGEIRRRRGPGRAPSVASGSTRTTTSSISRECSDVAGGGGEVGVADDRLDHLEPGRAGSLDARLGPIEGIGPVGSAESGPCTRGRRAPSRVNAGSLEPVAAGHRPWIGGSASRPTITNTIALVLQVCCISGLLFVIGRRPAFTLDVNAHAKPLPECSLKTLRSQRSGTGGVCAAADCSRLGDGAVAGRRRKGWAAAADAREGRARLRRLTR